MIAHLFVAVKVAQENFPFLLILQQVLDDYVKIALILPIVEQPN